MSYESYVYIDIVHHMFMTLDTWRFIYIYILHLSLATNRQNLHSNYLTNFPSIPNRKISGYNDVSGGSAYYWSCAFHCEGGQYFATEGCICACLTPAQEAAWRGTFVEILSLGVW